MLEKLKMKNITIALPYKVVEALEQLQKIGIIPSRSEGIRCAVKKLLVKDFAYHDSLMEVIR